jgi:hypothetical protein
MTNDPKNPKHDPKPGDVVPGPDADSKRSGRVSFDSRGNSVWEWQLETGVYSRDVNTQKLKKLDLGDLSIAETGVHKRPGFGEDEPAPAPGGGFNPYDNAPRSKQGGSNPYDKARAADNRVPPRAEAQKRPPPRSPDELRKLSEWIKMKKKLEQDK